MARKTNNSQLRFLTKEMQLHPDLTKPYPIQKYTRAKYEQLWLSLTDQLNALGPPNKTIGEWKRVWSDYKARLKTRGRKKCASAEVIDILRHLHSAHEDELCIEAKHDYMEDTSEMIEHSGERPKFVHKEGFNCTQDIVTGNTKFEQVMWADSTASEADNFDDPLHSPEISNSSNNSKIFKFEGNIEDRFLSLMERQTDALERQAAATEAILGLLKQQRHCL